MELGKVPPHDIDAEQAVLGSMLTDKDAVMAAVEKLKPDSFYREDNKAVYEAMVNLYNRAEPVDLVTVNDLMYGMILQSGNDASVAIQYAYSNNPEDFIMKMNEEIKTLNLKNSLFNNVTGLDTNEYNYTTTYDYAMIVKEVLKYEYLKTLLGVKKYQITLDNKKLTVTHKHKLLFNEDYIIGGKTGYTKKAGRTLLSIFENNEHIIIIVTFNISNDWNVHRNLAQKFL